MKIVRKLLTPDEITPPTLRYNPDCDCVQTTPDGGVTWIDSPSSDPRSAPQYQMPGISTSDPACDGAERIAAALKRSIDTTIASVNTVQLASALLDVFLFIVPVIGIIATAILIAANALVAIGSFAIDTAFTDDVYEQFKCIALCHLDEGGQFTADEWEAFQTECFDHFGPGTISDVLQINFDTLGMVGFNNAVSVGTETGDCSMCDPCGPWCYEWDFTINDGGWQAVSLGGRGTYSPGIGWIATVGDGYVDALINSFPNSDLHANVPHWEQDIEVAGASANGFCAAWFLTGSDSYNDLGYMSLDGIPTYPGYGMIDGLHTYTWDNPDPTDFPDIGVNAVVNDTSATVIVKKVRASGTGAMPAFTGGTDCS